MPEFDPNSETFIYPATLFEVTSLPAGEEPLHIREQWVGVRLPISPYFGTAKEFEVRELVTNDTVTLERAVIVRLCDAISVLRYNERLEAANYWAQLAVRENMTVIFDQDEGKLIYPGSEREWTTRNIAAE